MSHKVKIPFNLGDKVRDKVSGFEGVATAVIDYIGGCTQIQVTPRVDAEGKPRDSVWHDIERIEVVPEAEPVRVESRRTGGPSSNESYPSR